MRMGPWQELHADLSERRIIVGRNTNDHEPTSHGVSVAKPRARRPTRWWAARSPASFELTRARP